jgi:hypothetical protein
MNGRQLPGWIEHEEGNPSIMVIAFVLWGGLGTANLHEAQVHRRIAGDVRETS